MKAKVYVIVILILLLRCGAFAASSDLLEQDSILNLETGLGDIDEYVIEAFKYRGRNDIKNVILPSSILTIGEHAFENCRNLMEVEVPSGCERIEEGAFSKCKSLRRVRMSDSLKNINAQAFRECESLTSLVIPNGCKYILEDAFYGCKSLQTVEVPASVIYIGTDAFPTNTVLIVDRESTAERYAKEYGNPYKYEYGQQDIISYGQESEDFMLDLSSEENDVDIYEIPILQYENLYDIKSIKFSDSLLSIGAYAFSGCRRLSDVIIPSGCKNIYRGAFLKCTSLKTIEVPPSVTYIEEMAFPLDARLIVEKGSYAEKYARRYGIDYVYDRRKRIAKNVIGPILKTHWDQPLDYFYQEGKYGKYQWDVRDGICYVIAFAQVLNHLGVNVYGSHVYATSDNIYYRDFDQHKVDMSKLPAYIGHNSNGNRELLNYIENIAIVFEHEWNGREVKVRSLTLIKHHLPIQIETHTIKSEGKTKLEKIIRRNLSKNIPLYATLRSVSSGHAVVIDGIRKKNGFTEVHMNFGWGGTHDRWVTLQSAINVDQVKYFFEKIYEITPLDKVEMKTWKPYRLTDEQTTMIKNPPKRTAEISNDTLYIPEGTSSVPLYHKKYVGDTTIRHINLPSTLRLLPDVFVAGVNVEEIYIPRHVKEICPGFFSNMKNLKKIYYDSEEDVILYEGGFSKCNKLSTIEFGPHVKDVPDQMFYEKGSLRQIIWAENIERIGYAAFYHTRIKHIELPPNVKELGDFAFYSYSLESINIPNSVRHIGKDCFSDRTIIKCKKWSYAYFWAKLHRRKTENID